MKQLLKKGDRVRLNVRTLFGWKGVGTVVEDQITLSSTVRIKKDGADYDCLVSARRHEVSRIRKQPENGVE